MCSSTSGSTLLDFQDSDNSFSDLKFSATSGGNMCHADWWVRLPALGFLLVFYSN